MKKKKSAFPRSLLKNLIEEIRKLVDSNEGRIFMLEMIEDVPYAMRIQVIESLSSFYEEEMVSFFYLLKSEYGKELEKTCDRALEKFRLAGLDMTNHLEIKGSFYKAYASCTRHGGRMTLDVAWDTGHNKLQVECFYLTFNPDGIHSFFVIDDMSKKQYEQDRRALSDIVQLSLDEACTLINEAYAFNVRNMTRPALGRFLYEKYLAQVPSAIDINALMSKVSQRLTPRQVVNSYFHAVKSRDYVLLRYICSGREYNLDFAAFDPAAFIKSGSIILEGQAQEVKGSRQTARVGAYSLTLEEGKVYKTEYYFYLLTAQGTWFIGDIEQVGCELITEDSGYHPLNITVYCRVYEVLSLDALFELLDGVDNIREIQELPYGMHMRVSAYEDDFNHGVALLAGVIADLVVNGDEFVVIARDIDTLNEYHELFAGEYNAPLISRGEYQVGLMTAYGYLNGSYNSFEDILLQEEGEFCTQDGMRLLTARYFVKDHHLVRKQIEELKSFAIELEDGFMAYYRMDSEPPSAGMFVEYLLGPGWLSISAFGEHDHKIARQQFEEKMYDCLEYEGLELREEGIFDILTANVKKQYPDLENKLKDIYLDKWYYSHLASLRGMSPSEACQTEEGSQLLWAMFKKIKQNENKQFTYGRRHRIALNEYIRKVEQKKP
ncbi:hypothetical protein [Syntrophomonas palmitatica]|uniref:hypothetical protein n=1 Tax=Syntrophomonas palmitatica TaxID=402877 RepID=UPI0006D16F94|nr:hypothetical protein [Syntrophomonas palmitatica]